MSGLKTGGIMLGLMASIAGIGVVQAGQGVGKSELKNAIGNQREALKEKIGLTKSTSPMIATALLLDKNNAPIGGASFTQEADGVLVKAQIAGLGAGQYGFHIHTVGKCDGPDFASAGGHWNPTSKSHGKNAHAGPHMGDLDNITVAANGIGRLEQKLEGARLSGDVNAILDMDGASLMLHAGPDDYKTDPAGNSGARIACGQITPRG